MSGDALSFDVRFAQFLPAKKELVVLTADQKVHLIDTGDQQGHVPAVVTAAVDAH